MKQRFFLLAFLISSFFSLGISVPDETTNKTNKPEIKNEVKSEEVKEPKIQEITCIAEVVKIISDQKETLPGGNIQRSQQLLLRILTDKDKGKERVSLNIIPENPAFAIIGKVGEKYLVTKIENLMDGDEDYFIVDYYREKFIWWLGCAFLILLLLISGLQGFRTIVSLFLLIFSIAFILIPSIEKGINPLLSAIVVSFISTALTMLLVAGWNFKSLSATIGTVVGVAVSGTIATFVINNAPLSGLASSEAMILWANELYEINFKGLLAAGMIVSCLGAVMDISISVSSSIQEIKTANPSYTFSQLFKSGMVVGKDTIGTMTNTLVLAYTGMALPLLLLISHEQNPQKFINLELVVSEVTAALSGSIGLLIAVPVTAIIMCLLLKETEKKK